MVKKLCVWKLFAARDQQLLQIIICQSHFDCMHGSCERTRGQYFASLRSDFSPKFSSLRLEQTNCQQKQAIFLTTEGETKKKKKFPRADHESITTRNCSGFN